VDAVLGHVGELGARAARLVLTQADEDELRGAGALQGQSYRGVAVAKGQIGGESYVEATGAPSGATRFAV
jgi:hypothetical protein